MKLEKEQLYTTLLGECQFIRRGCAFGDPLCIRNKPVTVKYLDMAGESCEEISNLQEKT